MKRVHQLSFEQWLPISREEAWEFFSNPWNLPKITPQQLGFEIVSDPPERIYAGLVIVYRVRPLLKVPVEWVTEITHCREGELFVDEQRYGPYAFWHHLHTFEEQEGGVLMRDHVHYRLPFGLLAEPMRRLVVLPQLRDIFRFRETILAEYFPAARE